VIHSGGRIAVPATLCQLGVIPVAQSIRTEYLTGTALAVRITWPPASDARHVTIKCVVSTNPSRLGYGSTSITSSQSGVAVR
jgi:hypothetical protein